MFAYCTYPLTLLFNLFVSPDRWLTPPNAASSVPGVWGNQMSFSGGARACIGFKFALTE
jgi:cytochrome P450